MCCVTGQGYERALGCRLLTVNCEEPGFLRLLPSTAVSTQASGPVARPSGACFLIGEGGMVVVPDTEGASRDPAVLSSVVTAISETLMRCSEYTFWC